MAAQIGNQFWKNRRTHGRPTCFDNQDQLWNSCADYFEWCENNPIPENKLFANNGDPCSGVLHHSRPFTIGALCIHIGISRRTWEKYRFNDDFKDTVEQVDAIIYEQKFAGAAVGMYNQAIICRDLGLVEKTQTDHSSSDGTMTPKSFNDFYANSEPEKKAVPAKKKPPAKRKSPANPSS